MTRFIPLVLMFLGGFGIGVTVMSYVAKKDMRSIETTCLTGIKSVEDHCVLRIKELGEWTTQRIRESRL